MSLTVKKGDLFSISRRSWETFREVFAFEEDREVTGAQLEAVALAFMPEARVVRVLRKVPRARYRTIVAEFEMKASEPPLRVFKGLRLAEVPAEERVVSFKREDEVEGVAIGPVREYEPGALAAASESRPFGAPLPAGVKDHGWKPLPEAQRLARSTGALFVEL